MQFDAIVLAGGRSRRLGTDKALVRLGSKSLLEGVISSLAGANRLVVVAPEATLAEVSPDVPVLRALEDPPFGGPVAGIAAGLQVLPDSELPVALFACDLPAAAQGFQQLRPHLSLLQGNPDLSLGADFDGVCATDPNGRDQWLMGVYARPFLTGRLDSLRGEQGLGAVSVRRLMEAARLYRVPMSSQVTGDIDSPEDVQAWQEWKRLAGPSSL